MNLPLEPTRRKPKRAAAPAPERARIEIARFSTRHLPADERYAAWLGWGWPRIDAIYRTEPTEPFDTLFESAVLGEILFVRTEITGMRWERRLEDIRRSDFDPIIVNMMVQGRAQGAFDGRPFREEAGSFHFQDLAKPSIHMSTASLTFSMVMARPLATDLFGTLDDLHGLVVEGAPADLLLDHARRLWAALPSLDEAAAPALGRSLTDLLAAAAAQVRTPPLPVDSQAARIRQRAEAIIDTRLNAGISVAELGKALDVSRGSLFAAFRADGGVENYMRVKRLERAKEALADLERKEPIGTIAIRPGFCDASHLTRLFRARFGMTPREYRHLIADYPA